MARTFILNHKENSIKYTIKDFYLFEENLYSHINRAYDITDCKEKLVFQTHLKHFSRYKMRVIIDTYDLYILHKIGWL